MTAFEIFSIIALILYIVLVVIIVVDYFRFSKKLEKQNEEFASWMQQHIKIPNTKSYGTWISVCEQLPNDNQIVIFLDGVSNEIQMAQYNAPEKEFINCYGHPVIDVDYWMPLPKLPGENGTSRLRKRL